MVKAIALGTILKKTLELLVSSEKGRGFLGYVMGIAVFLVLLPVFVVYALFGWMSNGAVDIQVDSAIIERAEDAIESMESKTTENEGDNIEIETGITE